jgi:hypothetical protein
VALARRLAEIVYHVWKQECDYFTVIHHGVVRGGARVPVWSRDRLLDWAAPFTPPRVKRNHTSWARTPEEMTGARPLDDDASRFGSRIAFVPRPYTLISPAGRSRWPEEEASYR